MEKDFFANSKENSLVKESTKINKVGPDVLTSILRTLLSLSDDVGDDMVALIKKHCRCHHQRIFATIAALVGVHSSQRRSKRDHDDEEIFC